MEMNDPVKGLPIVERNVRLREATGDCMAHHNTLILCESVIPPYYMIQQPHNLISECLLIPVAKYE